MTGAPADRLVPPQDLGPIIFGPGITGPFGSGPGGWSVEPPTEPTGPFGSGPGGWSVEPPTESTGPFGTGPGGWSVEPPGTFEPPGAEPTPPSTEPTPLWVNYAKGNDGKRPTPPKEVKELPIQPVPGEPTGEPEKVEGDTQKKKAIELQNESVPILREHGVKANYLPKNENEHQPSPDIEVAGQTAEVKSPQTNDEKGIAALIGHAKSEQGATTVVVNLNRTRVTAQEMVRYFQTHHPTGVNTVYLIEGRGKNATVTKVSW